MTLRFPCLFAAAVFCIAAVPALARDDRDGQRSLAPLLQSEHGAGQHDGTPEWRQRDDDERGPARHDRRGGSDRSYHAMREDEAQPRFGYSPHQRAEWLDRCRANFRYDAPSSRHGEDRGGRQEVGDWDGYCEDYLARYEAGVAGHGSSPFGGMPVVWVKVPIIRERATPCACKDVIEEEWVDEAPRRRASPRRPVARLVPDKRLRSGK